MVLGGMVPDKMDLDRMVPDKTVLDDFTREKSPGQNGLEMARTKWSKMDQSIVALS